MGVPSVWQNGSYWLQYSHSPHGVTQSREPDQQIAEILERQHFALSQSPSNLDAEHLRDACAALLLAAKQLLEKTQQLTASKHREDSRAIPVHVLNSFLDADQESLSSINLEGSSEAHSTPADSMTWFDVPDMQSPDFDGWGGCSLWQPNDDAVVQDAFDSTSSCTEQWHDGADWPALQADDWPCFPG